ncbi:sensor histidine kinase [Nakamurella sp.]|uniref:sensor histidine kinase n=1 Tax=Nakamurella sp. TaxID=1869182 RepID=UPI0037831C18
MVDGGSAAEMSDGVRGWLVFYALATAGTVAIMLANAGGSGPRTGVAVTLVVATQAVYLLVARPATATLRGNDRRGWIFAVVAMAGFGAAVVLNPWSAMSLFALTPELFMLFTFGRAAAIIVALNTVWAMASLATGPAGVNDAVQQVGIALFIVTFSLFFGSRVVSIADRSAERLRLIGQLRDREAEVAALSAARGAEQERARIARDMHDTLAQGFTSIVTLSHAVRSELDTDPAAARRHVEMITRTATENLAESRRIIRALTPARLDGASLPQAVDRIVAAFTEETDTPARVLIEGQVRAAAAPAEVVALRVVQESLANVRKHANARSVEVRLSYAGDSVEIGVHDDGVGFVPDGPAEGFGLTGMRSRVADAGGDLDIRSAPDAGTTVTALVPLGVPG